MIKAYRGLLVFIAVVLLLLLSGCILFPERETDIDTSHDSETIDQTHKTDHLPTEDPDETSQVETDDSKIVFESDRDGNWGIYTMNNDGSNQTRLTKNNSDDFSPSCSPDGSMIVFSSNRDHIWSENIYIMNSDGSNQRCLAESGAYDSYPTFSPNGSKILFVSNHWLTDTNFLSSLYLVDVDGSNLTLILESKNKQIVSPSFSQDGSMIVFVLEFGQPDMPSSSEINIIDVDGSNQRYLVDGVSPSFSSNGSKVLFSGIFGGIQIMDVDGANIRYLANGRKPSFFVDETKIIFFFEGDDYSGLSFIDVDGNNLTRLADNSFYPYSFSDKMIVFETFGEIFIMDVDGFNQRSLAHGSNPAFMPSVTENG